MRKAILIGNSDYQVYEKLSLPENDVNEMERLLLILGFSIEKYRNLKYDNIKSVIEKIDLKDDELIFYFSGHGYSLEGADYITGVDAIDIHDKEYVASYWGFSDFAKALNINTLIKKLESNRDGKNILLFDMCRKKESKCIDKRIQKFVEVPIIMENLLMVYATTLDDYALEDKQREYSPFIEALKQSIFIKDISINNVIESAADYMRNNMNIVISSNGTLTNSYYLVDENNYKIEIEKENIKAILKIYENAKNEFDANDHITEKEMLSYLKGYIYYPQELIKPIINLALTSMEQKIGMLYIFLEYLLNYTIDIEKEKLSIYNLKNELVYTCDNKDYYDFSECIKFTRNLIKEDFYTDSYIYTRTNRKILIGHKENNYIRVGGEEYLHITGNIKKLTLKQFLRPTVEMSYDRLKIEAFINQLINCVSTNGNVIILGPPNTEKEQMVSCITEYFALTDKVLLLQDDTEIDVMKGQIMPVSTSVVKLFQDESDCLKKIKLIKDQIDKIIIPIKGYHEKLWYDDLIISKGNFIIQDYAINIIKNVGNEYMIKRFPYLQLMSEALIILLDNHYEKGTFVDSYYELVDRSITKYSVCDAN